MINMKTDQILIHEDLVEKLGLHASYVVSPWAKEGTQIKSIFQRQQISEIGESWVNPDDGLTYYSYESGEA